MTASDQIQPAFIEFWARMAGFWGIPPGTARVHAWLIAQSEAADAEAIMEGLGLSRGAVSMACRELVEWGLVNEERAPGSRRRAYHCEDDLEKLVRVVVQNRRRREWTPMLDRLDEWLPVLRTDRSKNGREFRERLAGLRALVHMADDMAEAFLAGGTLKGFGLKLVVNRAVKSANREARGA